MSEKGEPCTYGGRRVSRAAIAAIAEWGNSCWAKKIVGYAVAFIMLKPAAALIYAVAIKLWREASFDVTESGERFLGVILMVLAVLVLPALIGFVFLGVAYVISEGPGDHQGPQGASPDVTGSGAAAATGGVSAGVQAAAQANQAAAGAVQEGRV